MTDPVGTESNWVCITSCATFSGFFFDITDLEMVEEEMAELVVAPLDFKNHLAPNICLLDFQRVCV